MVLTGPQAHAFFTEPAQMGIPVATVAQLAVEGIATVSDLADFDEESLKQVAENLRRPAGRVPDPTPGAPQGATIPTPSFVFGAKSHKRLLVACDLVKYYNTTGRDLTVANIRWNQVIKNFEIQWKALKARAKDDDEPDVPKITRALTIIKWSEAFPNFLAQIIGVRTIPLTYVIRATVDVPAAPALANNEPHSTEHGSVEAELVARASHTHALYRDDNKKVYHYLEKATRGTMYSASIKPFERTKNGCGAWFALLGQYAGVDKWEAECKRQEQMMLTRRWKGQGNYTLESFVSMHRNAFVSMQACAQHIDFQLPNDFTRVGHLLDGIECQDAWLQAAMAAIRTDDGADGKRHNFEDAAAYIVPADPVTRKRPPTKRPHANISSAEAEANDNDANVSSTDGKKPSIGKTGVHLRYHKYHDYWALSEDQRKELDEWRTRTGQKKPNAKKSKKDDGKGNKRFTEKEVASLVDKRVENKLKSLMEEEKKDDDDHAYLVSVVESIMEASQGKASTPKSDKKVVFETSSTNATASAGKGKASLQSILRSARNAAAKK